jgi:hypothetical protein
MSFSAYQHWFRLPLRLLMGTETGIRGYGTYRDSSRYGLSESETHADRET